MLSWPLTLNEALARERKTQRLTPNKTFKWRHGARSPMTRYMSCSQTRQSNILWTLNQNTGQYTEPHGGQVESLWGKRRSSPWNPLFHPPWVHVASYVHRREIIVQELCESRGGRPGLSVLMSLLVSVDVKLYWTMLTHWSQLVPNMSTDIQGH